LNATVFDRPVTNRSACSSEAPETVCATPALGAWEIVWKEGGGQGPLKRLTFEADAAGYTFVEETLKRWSEAPIPSKTPVPSNSVTPSEPSTYNFTSTAEGADRLRLRPSVSEGALHRPALNGQGEASTTSTSTSSTTTRRTSEEATSTASDDIFLPPLPAMSTPSQLLSESQLRRVAMWLPVRHRRGGWSLLYSTMRDGISMQTMCRLSSGHAPTVLVVKDTKGHIFGGYASTAWRTSTRYYGTGECFVFQVEPRLVKYPWSKTSNDYFQFASADSLAMGGGGHFSIWLDSELQFGNSGQCQTFNSPTLASFDQFQVSVVELWGIT